MSKYLILGGDNAAQEIATALTSNNYNIVVIDTTFPKSKINSENMLVINQELNNIPISEYDNIFSDISTIIVLAGKRIAENTDESISILLGDKRFIDDIDAKTLLKIMEVRKIFTSYYPKKQVRIIAEMTEGKNRELFIDTKVDEIIPTDILLEKIIVQAIYNDGLVSELVIKLLTRNDKSHLTSFTVAANSEYDNLLGKTYDGLLIPLLEKGMQLVAIKKSFHNETSDTSNSSRNNIIINPVSSSDRNYSLSDKDELIVLKCGSH